MVTVTLPEQVERQLTKLAHNQAITTDELVQKAIQTYLHAEASQILEREAVAFRAMHEELLEKYFGEYVAIHHGKAIDHAPQLIEIYLRIDETYPDETVLIKQVLADTERVATIRSPKRDHDPNR